MEEAEKPKEGQLEAQSPAERLKNGGTNFIEKRIPLGLEIGTLAECLLQKIFKHPTSFLSQVTGICISPTHANPDV